jgi:hypothetical protein
MLTLAIGFVVFLAPLAALGQSGGDNSPRSFATWAPEEADSRWIPGLSALGAVLFQDSKASVSSLERGSSSSESRVVFGNVGASAELLSPALGALPGRPRLFVRGGLSFSFDAQEAIVNDGAPGMPRIVPPVTNPNADPPVASATGQGSATKVETQPLVLSAGAGLAFSIKVSERRLWIKPSLEWQWLEDEVVAVLGAAESTDVVNRADQCPCRTLFISASEKKGFHAIGPGLELELEAGRMGPFLLSIFGSGRALNLLGQTGVDVRATGTWSDGDRDAQVRSRYDRAAWIYRMDFGLRFRWLPE